jgi:hypothetical protein
MNPKTDSQLDYEVAGILQFHRGRQNPIDRWELVRRIFGNSADEPQTDDNLYDRRIRESVERQRPTLLICDMGDGRGRYLATSWKEYVEFHRHYLKRAWPLIKTGNAMLETAKRNFASEYEAWKRDEQQPALFDLTDPGKLMQMEIR